MSVSDDLNKAADILERDGWVQGSYHVTNQGPHCAVGSLERGVGISYDSTHCHLSDEEKESMWNQLSRLKYELGEFLGIGAYNIEDWNDRDGRTKDEVIQALRDAAIKLTPDEM